VSLQEVSGDCGHIGCIDNYFLSLAALLPVQQMRVDKSDSPSATGVFRISKSRPALANQFWLSERFQKAPTVEIVAEDCFAAVAAVH